MLVEDGPADVDLRRGIARITAELDSQLVSRTAAEHRQQFGGQLAYLPVTVQVILGGSVRQPILG